MNDLEQYRKPVFRVVRNILKSYDDAEDVIQDTFIKCRNVKFMEGFDPTPYLIRAAINGSIDHMRHVKAMPAVSFEMSSYRDEGGQSFTYEPKAEDPYADIDFEMMMNDVLEDVKPHLADTVRALMDCGDYQSCADELHVSIGTIKSRMHRLRKQLSPIKEGFEMTNAMIERDEEEIVNQSVDAPERDRLMKFTVSRKTLFDAVGIVGHAVSGRSSLPILSHILLQSADTQLRISATDLEISISMVIPALIQSEGGLTAPSRLLNELLGTLPEREVSLSVNPSFSVRVQCELSDYKLNGLPSGDYPKLSEIRNADEFVISQKTLRDMIRKTIFAVSTDESRPILTGIQMDLQEDTVSFVATDTHRLAIGKAPVKSGQGKRLVIIPSRAMNELNKLMEDIEGDVKVSITANMIQFITPKGISLISRLIEGQFPNFERVIPTGSTRRLTLQTNQMLRSVKRANILARDNAMRVVLRTTSTNENMTITAESNTNGEAYEEVEVVYTGEDVETAFNSKYLLELLNVIDAESFTLELTDPLKPGLIRPIRDNAEDGSDYFCVLMPMQIG